MVLCPLAFTSLMLINHIIPSKIITTFAGLIEAKRLPANKKEIAYNILALLLLIQFKLITMNLDLHVI
jgi:hypothetical protein